MSIQAQEACTTPKTQDQQGNMLLHIEVKILKTDFSLKKKVLKETRKIESLLKTGP